ncbi:MAG: alpha-glucan phosphorylase, partial [Phototrophicales bacterium]
KEVPIDAITNGVHMLTWVSGEMAGLFDRYLPPEWRTNESDPAIWEGVEHIPDSELWRTHERRRERLVAFARQRLRQQLIKRGAPQSEIEMAEEVLNPDALTIGFARRFATYKRATLIFEDLDRLNRILNNPDRPVQFIFAGKAHPHDEPGKAFIREIVRIAHLPEFRHKIVFLENYDMLIARYLVQGVDVWLNNPRRPKEASGTSGMKVIYNGGLNFSILDGWWAEAYEQFGSSVGWAIGNGEEYDEDDWEHQDRIEAQALLNVLENDLIPTFYERGRDSLPREWIDKIKQSMIHLAPFFNTRRMVQEYTEKYYMPLFNLTRKMKSPDDAVAKQYTEWRLNLDKLWKKIKVNSVTISSQEVKVDETIEISADVNLGELTPDSVRVELYYGTLNLRGEINDATSEAVEMKPNGKSDGSVYTFKAQIKSLAS